MDKLVPRTAESVLIKQKAAQPVGMKPEVCLRHWRNTRKVSQCFSVSVGNRAALLNTQIENFELSAPNSRKYVAHAVIETDFRMFICNARIARLCSPKTRLVYPLAPLRNQHPAAGSRNDLVSVKRKSRYIPQCSSSLSLVCCSEGLRRIFQHWHAISSTCFENWVHICALSVKMHHDDSPRKLVSLRSLT